MFKRIGVLSLLACVACASAVTDETDDQNVESEASALQSELNPNGRHRHRNAAGQASVGGMVYHGGSVLHGTTQVYFIWYGNWSGNTAPSILTDLVSHIGGSPYFNINTTYYDRTTRVSNAVAYAGSTVDAYSRGTNLSDTDVQTIVSSALSSGALPTNHNAVYFVLTSADVHETSGFCTQYCGWHTYSPANIKYAFVGNPDQCPASCSMQTSPNGNAGADGMASIIAHELEESVTDPNLNAWYDRRGYENADKCAWIFGNTYTTSNGSKANMKLGSRNFLIQQNWVNVGNGYCAVKY